jgi:hypothetical protein
MGARWAVLGLLLLAGCPGVPWRPEAYERAVRVETLELRFAPDGKGLLTLKLEVRNPSADTATLTAVDFELVVDGRRLAVGLQQVEVPLGGDGLPHALEVAFPLVSPEGDVGTGARLSHEILLTGGVLLRYGERTERRATFRERRVMELPWVPRAEPLLE